MPATRDGKAYAIRRTKEVLRQKQKQRNGSVTSGNSRERIWISTLRTSLKSILPIWRTDLEKVRLRINDIPQMRELATEHFDNWKDTRPG